MILTKFFLQVSYLKDHFNEIKLKTLHQFIAYHPYPSKAALVLYFPPEKNLENLRQTIYI